MTAGCRLSRRVFLFAAAKGCTGFPSDVKQLRSKVNTITYLFRTVFRSLLRYKMDTPAQVRDIKSKREDYLDWQEYFMATAFLAAKRSKDPCTQVGACIVNENNVIVGVGYNGMPKGCSDKEFPWIKESSDPLENKYLYVCHAELNAILNKNSADVRNCTLYVALFPCNECAKVIIQSGIKEVVYMSDKHASKVHTIASKRMFDAVGVKYKQFIPKNKKIVIDFSEINWNNMNQLPGTPVKSNSDEINVNGLNNCVIDEVKRKL